MGLTLAAVALLPGLALGSFLNVVAARIPLRRSLISPGSACMSCATPLAWYDNVPLLSFALLRGRCRHCKAAIPWRYPLVEATTGLLVAACVLRFGSRGTPPSVRSSAPRSSQSRPPTPSGA
jgi:leader peptidase (prepilin peptidase)/N-methyltransferase